MHGPRSLLLLVPQECRELQHVAALDMFQIKLRAGLGEVRQCGRVCCVRLRLLAQPCFLKVLSDRRCKGAVTVAIRPNTGHNFYTGCGCVQLECLPLALGLGVNGILADAQPDTFAVLPPV